MFYDDDNNIMVTIPMLAYRDLVHELETLKMESERKERQVQALKALIDEYKDEVTNLVDELSRLRESFDTIPDGIGLEEMARTDGFLNVNVGDFVRIPSYNRDKWFTVKNIASTIGQWHLELVSLQGDEYRAVVPFGTEVEVSKKNG